MSIFSYNFSQYLLKNKVFGYKESELFPGPNLALALLYGYNIYNHKSIYYLTQ